MEALEIIRSHVLIQKALPEGSNSDIVILVDEGREDPKPLKAGHHRPTSETPFNWAIIGPLAKRHLNGVSLVGR